MPIRKISTSNIDLKQKLLQIPGILINDEPGRVYPLGKEARTFSRLYPRNKPRGIRSK